MFNGKTFLLSLGMVCVLGLFSSLADARLSAKVDRNDVGFGETLRLTLTGDDGEDPDDIDLSTLQQEFEIVQRSSAKNARFINGESSVTRTLELELLPRREGVLTIPPLIAGGRSTTPIAVRVSPAKARQDVDSNVVFDATVDKTEAYVQEQIILTVALQQAITLDNRAVSELTLEDSDVVELEQRSYQRRINGKPWQVTELRYAIFPQKSGTLTIPRIIFSGREVLPGRSLLGARLGQRIEQASEPITVTIKPIPSSYPPGATWLPAKNLTLSERWSSDPSALRQGDSSTRTLILRADGLQSSQLPTLGSLLADQTLSGLKLYPDQETLDQQQTPEGLVGLREQSEALVAASAGNWRIPELRIPWWDINNDRLAYATLAPVSVTIDATTPVSALDVDAAGNQLTSEAAGASQATLRLWQLTALVSWLLLLAMVIYLVRLRSQARKPSHGSQATDNAARALIALRLACDAQDAAQVRNALIAWARKHFNAPTMQRLQDIRSVCSPALEEQISHLDQSLYRKGHTDWDSKKLLSAVKQEPKPSGYNVDTTYTTLYPTS